MRLCRHPIDDYLAGLLCVGARKPKTMAGNMLLDDPGGHRLDLKAGLRRIARGIGLMRPPLRVNGYADRYAAAGAGHNSATAAAASRLVLGGGFDLIVDGRRLSSAPPGLQQQAGGGQGTAAERRGDHTHDWKEVAHVLDRLFFIVVLLFMSASAMIIILVPYYKEELFLNT